MGKLRVFVRSRKVPVGLTEFSMPTVTGSWILSQSPVRAVVYANVLDDAQESLVSEAQRLACSSGLDLEVVDLGKMGVLQRILWSRIIWPASNATSTGLGLIPSVSPLSPRYPEFERPMKTN
jgi:hypothetical protein